MFCCVFGCWDAEVDVEALFGELVCYALNTGSV